MFWNDAIVKIEHGAEMYRASWPDQIKGYVFATPTKSLNRMLFEGGMWEDWKPSEEDMQANDWKERVEQDLSHLDQFIPIPEEE